jgi:hypothetical protein
LSGCCPTLRRYGCPAFEFWRYAYINGIGRNVLLEFVDTNGTGEFRQSIDPASKLNLLKAR